MIVYVETNFFLEIALGQEEVTEASQILIDAGAGKCGLRFPAFCVTGALTGLNRWRADRNGLTNLLRPTIRNLGRSARNAKLTTTAPELIGGLLQANETEEISLTDALRSAFLFGTVIPITAEIFDQAESLVEPLAVTPQDANVLASILADARRTGLSESIFVSRDKAAFDKGDVRNQLSAIGCRFLSFFKAAAGLLLTTAGAL